MRSFRDWSRLLQALPRETLDLIERAQAGELRINVEQRGIEKPINRLAYGIIASAVLLASALLWASSAPPTLWGISIFGVLGVVLAFLLGVHVLFLIWRSG
ncbi:MAG: hypothetical protein IPK16_09065 [Anaerolineales bacterium]|nr:hypothetical protein [Anaerolineales bacterium]